MITNAKKINKTHVLLREILLEQSYNILLVQGKKKRMKISATLKKHLFDLNREMQTKTSVGQHHTSVRMAIIKKSKNNKCWRGCGERECWYTVGGNVNWFSHHGQWYADFSEN